MKNENLKKLNELIKMAKRNANNPKRPKYSPEIRNSIIELTNRMSNIQITRELGVSGSFIARLKKRSKNLSINKKSEPSSKFQFLQVDDQFNNFMKDDHFDNFIKNDKAIPTIKLTTNGGVTIEIFS